MRFGDGEGDPLSVVGGTNDDKLTGLVLDGDLRCQDPKELDVGRQVTCFGYWEIVAAHMVSMRHGRD